MSMSDGKKRLKRIAFEIDGKMFRFAINPESYSHKKPHRSTVIKTKSRIVVEDFQSDIPTITISGSTGYNPTGKEKDKGLAKIKEMKKFLEDYAESGGNGKEPPKELKFHNFTNDESFIVHLTPEGVTYTQDVNSPLTYNYEINLYVLRGANIPKDDDIMSPELGSTTPTMELEKNTGTNKPSSNTPSRSETTPIHDGIYEEDYKNDSVIRKNSPTNPQNPSKNSANMSIDSLLGNIGFYGGVRR